MNKEIRLIRVELQRIQLLGELIKLDEESLSLSCWKPVQNESGEPFQVYFGNDNNLPRYQVMGGGWGMYVGHIEQDENGNIMNESSVSPLQKKTINGIEFMVVEKYDEPDLLVLERDLQYADPY